MAHNGSLPAISRLSGFFAGQELDFAQSLVRQDILIVQSLTPSSVCFTLIFTHPFCSLLLSYFLSCFVGHGFVVLYTQATHFRRVRRRTAQGLTISINFLIKAIIENAKVSEDQLNLTQTSQPKTISFP